MLEKDNPLKAEKRKKLHALKERGINPFPYAYSRTHTAVEFHKEFNSLGVQEKLIEKNNVCLAGRVLTRRPMGKAAFFNISDQSGSVQVYLKIEELPEVDRFSYENLDLGDIVGVEGYPFRTKTGELSLHAQKFVMLTKTIEPLPEKFHGLADVELKYRLRHLDLIMSPESRKIFETRSKIIKEVRNFLDARGFLEVETPILQPLYGGAAAKPFTTKHNALDMTLYMKISPEIYLKRLIVGGFEKVYDLNKNFRNEGIDRSHNPEFTMLEWYEAYTDYNYQMKQFEDLVSHVVKTVTGSFVVSYQGKEIDFKPPWRRVTVYDALKEHGGYDVIKMSAAEIFKELQKLGADVEKPESHGEMVMMLFDQVVEKQLWQPTFVTDHPIEISPLTKVHRKNSKLVERFEPYVAQMELGNAYSELNDPEEQLSRLQEQDRKVGEQHQPIDEDFIHAIDVGMPPTGGVGLGVERLVMIITDQPSIRDIILFPTMRRNT